MRHIIFASDESDNANKALSMVFAYLLRPHSHLTVVLVSPSEQEKVHAIERTKSLLKAIWSTHRIPHLNMGIRAIVGSNVGKAICEVCDEIKDASMLVLGSAGKSNVKGLMVGSVSNYCLAHAACPVIVARFMENVNLTEHGHHQDCKAPDITVY